MDSYVSPKGEIWFLRMCHHISNAVYHVTVTLSEAGELKSKDPVRLDTFLFVQVHYTAFSLDSYSDRIVKTAVPRSSICYIL